MKILRLLLVPDKENHIVIHCLHHSVNSTYVPGTGQNTGRGATVRQLETTSAISCGPQGAERQARHYQPVR